MKQIKTAGIIGRGAVGVIFGSLIHQYLGYEQTYFIGDASRIARYREDGLIFNGQSLTLNYVSNLDDHQTCDLLLIATKYTAIDDVIPLIKDFIHDKTIIISAINGIVSEDDLRRAYGRDKVVRCIAQKMSSVYDGHQVIAENFGELVFGEEDAIDHENVVSLCHFFDAAGVPYVLSKDIVHDAYSKLMLNCAVNQASAAYDVGYGGYQADAPYREEVIATMNEVRTVAEAEGIIITDEEVADWLKAVDSFPPDSMPSMRQDVLAKRKTEVKLFGQTIVDLGKKHQIPTPYNAHFVELITEIEKNY